MNHIIIKQRLACILLIMSMLCFNVSLAAPEQTDQLEKPEPLPLEQIELFAEIFARIKRDYIETITDQELLKHAISGMLSGLDPHSVYLDVADYQELQVDTEGKFGGLGIEIIVEKGYLKVVTPLDDTPASRVGILAGDLITQIDGTKIFEMTQAQTVELLRGKPGSKVRLKIVREGVKKPLKLTLKRTIINIASVKSRLLENDYGYIRITQFQRETGLSLRKAIAKLKRKSNNSLKGAVLDLRNNPGGVLGGAIDVSNSFLNSGTIVSTRGRNIDVGSSYNASEPDLLEAIPMIVLVNGGTASAAEIVAGALQDHDRAVVMGTRTFGKGSVQTIFPLNDDVAVKFTTARYYTPNDRSIQTIGIEPDIIVEKRIERSPAELPQGIREADLPGHLENESGIKGQQLEKSKEYDYQLTEALKLLKGINIANSGKQD